MVIQRDAAVLLLLGALILLRGPVSVAAVALVDGDWALALSASAPLCEAAAPVVGHDLNQAARPDKHRMAVTSTSSGGPTVISSSHSRIG